MQLIWLAIIYDIYIPCYERRAYYGRRLCQVWSITVEQNYCINPFQKLSTVTKQYPITIVFHNNPGISHRAITPTTNHYSLSTTNDKACKETATFEERSKLRNKEINRPSVCRDIKKSKLFFSEVIQRILNYILTVQLKYHRHPI